MVIKMEIDDMHPHPWHLYWQINPRVALRPTCYLCVSLHLKATWATYTLDVCITSKIYILCMCYY